MSSPATLAFLIGLKRHALRSVARLESCQLCFLSIKMYTEQSILGRAGGYRIDIYRGFKWRENSVANLN